MRFFVLAAQGPTPAQQNTITTLFSNNDNYGYWHWLPDFWIITSGAPVTSEQLRDTIKFRVPGLIFIVLAVDPVANDWAGWTPTEWGDWLRDQWKQQ